MSVKSYRLITQPGTVAFQRLQVVLVHGKHLMLLSPYWRFWFADMTWPAFCEVWSAIKDHPGARG